MKWHTYMTPSKQTHALIFASALVFAPACAQAQAPNLQYQTDNATLSLLQASILLTQMKQQIVMDEQAIQAGKQQIATLQAQVVNLTKERDALTTK